MFQTARFKIHNPSRHKTAVLSYALRHYHLTLKRVLEEALRIPELQTMITKENKKGKPTLDKSALGRILYRIAPKAWPLAPLRDYLIGDASAMLLSYYEKALRGDTEVKPPTLPFLDPMTEDEKQAAVNEFATTVHFALPTEDEQKIEAARAAGQPHLASKFLNISSAKAERNAYRGLLRKMEAPLPRPLEFTRCEFSRGFLLARNGDNFYLMVRLFSKGHRHWKKLKLDEGFVNWRTKEAIGGLDYPGCILPLEFGRDYHEREYLAEGEPKSAKVIIKRNDAGQEEWYVHIAFEFKPEPIATETFLGIDRGAARIGAGTVIDKDGIALQEGLYLEGQEFAAEQRHYLNQIAEAQRKSRSRPRLFRLRRRRANIVVGEYANKIIEAAVQHRSQIVVEDINARAMNRFLSRSQFQKLQSMLDYKAERVGLPKPITVPAAYTSQTCPRCGHQAKENRPKADEQGRPIQDVFYCRQCGRRANADDNASEVIALRALHQIGNGGRYQKFHVFQQWLVDTAPGRQARAERACV
jgi:putative transposase